MVFFGASEGAEWDLFQKVARNNDDKNWGFYHADAECAAEYKTTVPGLAILRTFDSPINPYTGDLLNMPKIQTFMQMNQVPTVFEFAPEYINTVFKEGNPSCILFYKEEEY